MRKKQAAARSKTASIKRPPGQSGPADILVAGIPVQPLVAMIRERYPGKINLYVAESRPHEVQVARAIAAIDVPDVSVSIVTDNMIAALFATVAIRAVYSQYLETVREHVIAINGAHMAALMAQIHRIPFYLYPLADLPAGEPGRFAGEDIRVDHAACIDWEPDRVPLDLVSEVIAHGNKRSEREDL